MDFKKSVFSIFIYNSLLLSTPKLYAANFVDPRQIFPTTSNEKIPSQFWLENKKPYPTNAWFINLVLNQTNPGNAVNVFPYSIKISPRGISLSYTRPTFYAEPDYPSIISAFYYQFENQLTLGASTPMNNYGLASYHGLKITLQWQNDQQQKITAPILQGSPYLTEFFTNTIPQLSTRFKIRSINQQTKTGPLAKAQRYELILALNEHDTQTWLLYSESPILFNWNINSQGEYLISSEPYSGWIRLVLQKDTQMHVDNDAALLDAYRSNIPLDYQQDYFVTDQNLIYSFSWQTQNNKPPLMLSLPHQRNAMPQSSSVTYPGIKGLMLGENKVRWEIGLPNVPVLFLEPKNLSPEQIKILHASLLVDVHNLLRYPFPDDGPYQVGKRYARAARLILIANYLKEYTLQRKMLDYLETHLRKKMLAKSGWRFQYDTTWGGIIPSIDDYGARHYNDHHYHYGYWVYTFAVIAQFDRTWLSSSLKPKSFTPKQWIETLIRDYANEDKGDPYFPVQRYQDDYAGHSWASGLTSFVDGQNQQSSSEAVNAYYAMALYAAALHDKKLLDWARFLMTRELVSAQTYWQIPKDSAIYSDKFKEHNQVVANLWDNKIDTNAFFIKCNAEFRCGLEYSFGIEMLPFTAVTSELLNKKWLKDAYPAIKKLIANEYGPIPPAWQWILIKGIAAIMDKNEKEYFLKKVMDSKPAEYDNGDSKTNTLYFLI
ncbi:glycosyl hydrolase [Legionella fallonii]|uniref:glucan endo-1,3-beta-D-glucosidase n=1 Tax=Legionella fallonii LLAP-10 TaxID=1212491 RepID=A0A098G0Q4_9GAMM|nr:glycosyl hydrolase [Legionella fallonii]CEG56043.1 Endo-1,3(4)-beta-glucanase [Legionella fallonii LLAP-10]